MEQFTKSILITNIIVIKGEYMKLVKFTISAVATTLLASSLGADTHTEIEKLKAEIAELKEITQTLADETSSLKTGVGLNYFPHEQVVVKLDHAMQKGGFGDSDTTSVSLGFIF